MNNLTFNDEMMADLEAGKVVIVTARKQPDDQIRTTVATIEPEAFEGLDLNRALKVPVGAG